MLSELNAARYARWRLRMSMRFSHRWGRKLVCYQASHTEFSIESTDSQAKRATTATGKVRFKA
jgi:hypothetical protein